MFGSFLFRPYVLRIEQPTNVVKLSACELHHTNK
nr:MAG TPA: hypothetical protein [Caudoviricetes sp.]